MNNLPNYPQDYNCDVSSSKTFGIISLILSIVGILCCSSIVSLFISAGAIVVGIIALCKKEPRGFAIAGLATGAVGIVFAIIKLIIKIFASAEFLGALLETAKDIQPY